MSSFVLFATLLSAPNLNTESTPYALKANAKASFVQGIAIQRGMGVLPPLKPKNS